MCNFMSVKIDSGSPANIGLSVYSLERLLSNPNSYQYQLTRLEISDTYKK